MKKIITVLSLLLVLAGCTSTDVVGKVAKTSFSELMSVEAGQVATTGQSYVYQAPSKTEYLTIGEQISITLGVEPFLAAGLDVTKLPTTIKLIDNQLVISLDTKGFTAKPSITEQFELFVDQNRDTIGYHEALDHYGIALGNGNMFEWAKDITTNDKDIVFVLNPEPFIAAGVDVANVEGWVFAKVEVMMDGKTQEVDKLLKPFNIK
jgi:hypothetical protein